MMTALPVKFIYKSIPMPSPIIDGEAEDLSAPKTYSHILAGFLNAACGLCWTIAYILYVRQAQIDESYGMPLIALVCNITWEFVYTFLWPVKGIGRIFHFPWVFIDGLLLAETFKHGPRMWNPSSPLVAENFSTILTFCTVLALTAQWTFASQFSQQHSSFWSAYLCQAILSWGSLWMLLTRGHTGGHSMTIWWFRFLGSLAANLRYTYRVYQWPAKYGFIGTSFATWILWTPCVADVFYPLLFSFIVQRVNGGKKFTASSTNETLGAAVV